MDVMTNGEQDIAPAPSIDPEIEAMLSAGVHVGHIRSKRHPAMEPYLWGVRNNVELIDLTKTKEKLAEAERFLETLSAARKLILFVGTRPAAKQLVRDAAEATSSPYVTGRWIGGTLTNFAIILKRIEELERLEQEQASGGFEKYPKRERLEREKEIGRLRENFDGLRRLRKLPDVLVIIDASHDDLALREAERIGVPVVALTDTNTDPRRITYPIPANDDARPSITYILSRIRAAILRGQELAARQPAEDGAETSGVAPGEAAGVAAPAHD